MAGRPGTTALRSVQNGVRVIEIKVAVVSEPVAWRSRSGKNTCTWGTIFSRLSLRSWDGDVVKLDVDNQFRVIRLDDSRVGKLTHGSLVTSGIITTAPASMVRTSPALVNWTSHTPAVTRSEEHTSELQS